MHARTQETVRAGTGGPAGRLRMIAAEVQRNQERSVTVTSASRSLRAAAARIQAAARHTRAQCFPERRSFSLDGMVDGVPVRAVIRDGEVFASERLLRRADLVARVDEQVRTTRGELRAGISGPPEAVMVTLIRACDRPVRMEMGRLAPRTGPGRLGPLVGRSVSLDEPVEDGAGGPD